MFFELNPTMERTVKSLLGPNLQEIMLLIKISTMANLLHSTAAAVAAATSEKEEDRPNVPVKNLM